MRIIILTTFEADEYVFEAIRAGASGFLVKDTEPVGFQNSATGPDLGFYAARSYSLMRPPRPGRRWTRSWERFATR